MKPDLEMGKESYALPIEKATEIGQFQALANSLEDLNLPLEDHVQLGVQGGGADSSSRSRGS